MRRLATSGVLLLVVLSIWTANCFAQDATAFYKGKTIVILVTSAPGGTFDLISRAVAPSSRRKTSSTRPGPPA